MADQFYLYLFETAERRYTFTNVAHRLLYEDEEYVPAAVSHSAPTFSSEPEDGRVTVTLEDDLRVALDYVSHPPPYQTKLTILEVTAASEVEGTNTLQVDAVEPYWRGRLVRVNWRDSFRVAEILCKTLSEIHFSRETNTESLHPLCRALGPSDPRCPVNWEDFKETVTVDEISEDTSEPTVTVVGITTADDWYKGGMIRTSSGDVRTIEAHAGGVLTLNRAFPSTTLQEGDTVEIFAGDDHTKETCSVKFDAATDGGEAWLGWDLTPNRDFQKDGFGEGVN